MVKNVKVSDKNHRRLGEIASWYSTLDGVIGMLLDDYDKKNRRKVKSIV